MLDTSFRASDLRPGMRDRHNHRTVKEVIFNKKLKVNPWRVNWVMDDGTEYYSKYNGFDTFCIDPTSVKYNATELYSAFRLITQVMLNEDNKTQDGRYMLDMFCRLEGLCHDVLGLKIEV